MSFSYYIQQYVLYTFLKILNTFCSEFIYSLRLNFMKRALYPVHNYNIIIINNNFG